MHSLDPVVTVRGVTSRCPFGVFLELPRSFLFTKLIVHFPWHLDVDAVFAKSFTAIAWKTPGTAYLPMATPLASHLFASFIAAARARLTARRRASIHACVPRVMIVVPSIVRVGQSKLPSARHRLIRRHSC